MVLLKKKKQEIWIFKAYDRAGKGLFYWEFGDHTRKTFKRVFERLKKWKILFYCGNHWEGFNKIISSPCLFQGKDKTFSIEQN
ncbi:IS1 transposase [Holospora elegans E1]|uniref:IS1 transposase n=1 Tax=Holospora elegans E1 TaxID=1427503 RepID=A0A023DZ18_9PROT|nr:IS1 family transposase [Holospora elegans]GAJ46077.1 IS1 transposase [Holospora elegans E1]